MILDTKKDMGCYSRKGVETRVGYNIHFYDMKKFRKDKKEWEIFKKDLYRWCMNPELDISDYQRQMVYYYKDGLFETPKKYIDGYAYNDGTWKKFSTGCMYKSGYRGMMVCGSKKSLIDCLYAYMCFLKKMGVDDGKVFGYFTVVYILTKLDFKDGMFTKNQANINILSGLIGEVKEKDVDDICCDCDDERRYCIDPRYLICKSSSTKVKIQRKKDKELDWKKIEELYDDSKTNAQNLMVFHQNGLVISERTLQRWKKSRG